MNDDEKNRVAELRKAGIGYRKIAQIMNLNVNSVKSYCRRTGLSTLALKSQEKGKSNAIQQSCKNCGELIFQSPGRKKKLFCCDACRIKWWNTHLTQVNRKAMYNYICPTCGRPFSAYGNRHRKYCSHECYIAARFGVFPCD